MRCGNILVMMKTVVGDNLIKMVIRTTQNPQTGHWLGTIVGSRNGKMVIEWNKEFAEEIELFLKFWGDGIEQEGNLRE